ncbi:MAG: hypothetical protein C0592_05040 [Marinilabiliales bacterium]|nr:MAG: hypothetical protein C0592_05040 [Marinilabiliales bacterium]
MKENKLFQGKTLAILTGGGDTPALNSSIENIRNRAQLLGYKVYGIRHGWRGLLGDGDVVDLTNQAYDGIYGGTALRSSRTNPFPSKKNPENRVPQILKNLNRYGIDVLVSIGGDDTNGAAKRLYETEGIPVIGFPKTIDNDLRTRTIHHYGNMEIEAVMCPGYPSALKGVMELTQRIKTTAESHSRIIVLEVMGRDAGWLVGGSSYGQADMILVPEYEMDKSRKSFFMEQVKEKYMRSRNKSLVIAVSEGVKWYMDDTEKTDVVYASTEVDEYGHPRLGGISGVIASEISNKLGIEARAQSIGYFARSGECRLYDRKLTSTLADKVVDLLLREDYGKMPVLSKMVRYPELEEFNTATIDMGNIGNQPLPDIYYDVDEFRFNDAYYDFMHHILGDRSFRDFNVEFPTVLPD